MRLRSRRRSLPVWGSPVSSRAKYGPLLLTHPTRTRRFRRGIRTGLLLSVVGLVRLAAALLGTRDDSTRRSRLRHELAGYLTVAQRRDLAAILDRYPDDVTYELRDIITR